MAGSGTLVVLQSRTEGAVYIEGAFAYVDVTDESGTMVARIEDPEYHLAKEIAKIDLRAGHYRIKSFVRPCHAACPVLDEPTDSCELAIDLEAARTIEVRVQRQSGRPCLASA